MNITEWQSKMIRSSPKSIMKHANKQLEMLGAISGGDNGSFKDTVKLNLPYDEKKARKGNIDMLTGKRKYTKKLLKLDGILSNSKTSSCATHDELLTCNLLYFLEMTLKERKKHRKRRGSITLSGGVGPHVPRKYTFKKRIRKLGGDGISLQGYHPNGQNGINGVDKHFEPITRSKNTSPVPNSRPEK